MLFLLLLLHRKILRSMTSFTSAAV
jgi:hypothetical protein